MGWFEAKTVPEHDRVVVALHGECDLSVRAQIAAVLTDAVRHCRLVTVDLSEVTFLDSSGIHELIAAHHAALERGGRVYVVNAHGEAASVLELTGVGELLRPPPEDMDEEPRHE